MFLGKKSLAISEIIILLLGLVAFSILISDSVEAISVDDVLSGLESSGNSGGVFGCCFDNNEGMCLPNVEKDKCLEGVFFEGDSLCESSECYIGCCLIGVESQMTTEMRCKYLAELAGKPYEFKDAGDYGECLGISDSQAKGACTIPILYENKNECFFGTRVECDKLIEEEAVFHPGKLCSHPDLRTSCERQVRTSCVETLDEIYWFDSCGNIENIYDSDRERSWNNGMILSKSESCGFGSGNINSEYCGNCDYNLGSLCKDYKEGVDIKKIKDGLQVCRDLNCKSAPGHAGSEQDRIHGESWCVYDSQIGSVGLGSIAGAIGGDLGGIGGALGGLVQGLLPGGTLTSLGLSVDPVGSRHWRYYCLEGEVLSEGCADYRREICVQKEDDGRTNAFCRVNTWEQCLSYMGQQGCETGCKTQCGANPDCTVQSVEVDKDFKFNACVPKYPPGFELGLGDFSEGGIEGIAGIAGSIPGVGGQMGQLGRMLGGFGGGSSETCGMASQTCTVVYQKKCPGGWKCVANCDCMEYDFTVQMNNICVSAGDCGVYVNYKGTPTLGGASISKKGSKGKLPPQPALLAPIYAIFANPISGQYARPGQYDEVPAILNLGLGMIDPFMSSGPSIKPSVSSGMFSSGQLGGTIMGGIGGMGAGAGVGAAAGVGAGTAAGVGTTFASTTTFTATSATTIGGVGTIGGTTAVAAGETVVLPAGANIISGGGTVGAGAGAGAFVMPVLIGAVVVLGVMFAMGCGKTETVEIKFDCKKWEQPVLNQNCDACTEDPLRPCTKYRCESLGSGCKIINEGTGYEECLKAEEEPLVPTITPWEDVLDKEKYGYFDVSNNGFKVRTKDRECIEAFTPLTFGVQTDTHTKCKISMDRNMTGAYDYFYESRDRYSKNHTYATFFASAESMIAEETLTVEEFNELIEDEELFGELLNELGEINFYVKCENPEGRSNDHDYVINFCVDPGPDRSPPVIISHSPPENSVIAHRTEEQEVKLWINEPAECKWSLTRPMTTNLREAYNSLENSMSCQTSASQGTILGYECITKVPISQEELENNFYFLCKDQPWLQDSDERNIGAKDGMVYEYKLFRSEFDLEIQSIKPEEKVVVGSMPAFVDLEVRTAKGFDDGKAVCGYKLEEFSYLDFYLTNSNIHQQERVALSEGENKLTIRCIDEAGNFIEKEHIIEVEVDTIVPEVTRVYHEGGSLVLATNKNAFCYYVTEDEVGCNFDFDEGEMMNKGPENTHTLSWNEELTHYIKCKDIFENKPRGCSIIIRPYYARG